MNLARTRGTDTQVTCTSQASASSHQHLVMNTGHDEVSIQETQHDQEGQTLQ